MYLSTNTAVRGENDAQVLVPLLSDNYRAVPLSTELEAWSILVTSMHICRVYA